MIDAPVNELRVAPNMAVDESASRLLQATRRTQVRDLFRCVLPQLEILPGSIKTQVLESFAKQYGSLLQRNAAPHDTQLPYLMTLSSDAQHEFLRRFAIVAECGDDRGQKLAGEMLVGLGKCIKSAVDASTKLFCDLQSTDEQRENQKTIVTAGINAARAAFIKLSKFCSSEDRERFEKMFIPSLEDIRSAEKSIVFSKIRCLVFKGIFADLDCGRLSQAVLNVFAGSPCRVLHNGVRHRRVIGPVLGKFLRLLAMPTVREAL